MRKFTNIDNEFAVNHNLNLSQVYVYEWMLNLPKWANHVVINNQVFYYASKNKACDDMPIVTKKRNTMHKHYKFLEDNGFIIIKKIEGKDYVHLTEKSKQWNSSNHLEKNPSLFGKKSKSKLEKNPTNSKLSYSEVKTEIDFKKLLKYINKKTGRGFRVINENVRKSYRARIRDGYKKIDITKAIDNAVNVKTHRENGFQYLTPEFFSRSSTLDKYGFKTSNTKKEEVDFETEKKEGNHVNY